MLRPRAAHRNLNGVVSYAARPLAPHGKHAADGVGLVEHAHLANAGGVTASYFEWAQSRQGYAWDDGVVAERLRKV